jgi:hypothetical protein
VKGETAKYGDEHKEILYIGWQEGFNGETATEGVSRVMSQQ